MNYNHLLNTAKERVPCNTNDLPQNAFNIASQLNLRLKNSIECKEDFKECYPLEHTHAVYALYKDEYTIYYDEKYPYKNFEIMHEISHHLLQHTQDNAENHDNAQMMAAILVAPPKLIKKHKIKSSTTLSKRCKIPIDIAEMYWTEIKNKRKHNYKQFYINFIIRSISILTLLLAFLTSYFSLTSRSEDIYNKTLYVENTPTNMPTNIPIEQPTTLPHINESIVYITSTGRKFHRRNCSSISNSSSISEMPLNEALENGYGACQRCLPLD